jgi:hypothetical protein
MVLAFCGCGMVGIVCISVLVGELKRRGRTMQQSSKVEEGSKRRPGKSEAGREREQSMRIGSKQQRI